MMQEVPCDDTNGESTFEFVEGKIEGLTLSDDGIVSLAPTVATPTPITTITSNLTPLDLGQSIASAPTEVAMVTTMNTAPPPTAAVAAPSALPSFLTNFQATSTETTPSFPTPLSSTIPPGPAPIQFQQTMAPNFTMPTTPPQYSYSPAAGNPYSLSSKQQRGYTYPPPMMAERIRPQHQLETGPPMIQQMVPQAIPQMNPNTGISLESVVQSQPVPFYSTAQSGGATSVAVPFGDYDYGSQQQMSTQFSDHDPKGLFGWLKETMPGTEFFSKVAEKAKNSMDSMITTLDPQMKQYIYSGGDIDLVVASHEEDIKVTAVREAFQIVFGRASVRGVDSPSTLAPQLVGFSAALKAAEERIHHLHRGNLVHEQQPIIAVESFLAEFMPDRWYDLSCLVLQDPMRQILLNAYTQPIPVSSEAVQKLQEQTPPDYPLRWSGLAMNIGSVLTYTFQVPHTEWHEAASGIQNRDMILMAAKTLAMQYKRRLYSGGSS